MNIYILLSLVVLVRTVQGGLWSFIKGALEGTAGRYSAEDGRLNISQLAAKYKYPFEEHQVHTIDGYIINFHRIPNRGPIVFLMHGILESSDSWVLLGPGKALAYVLAEQGYDVWMGNARGNQHANKHVSMNTTMSRFWEFTWEEIALYDLPAMISYILETTRQHSMYYVGHSQGTTSGYVLCAMRPQYNNYIRMMFSLAPVAWMGNVKSPLVRMFSPAYNVLAYALKDFNTYTSGLDMFNKMSSFVCTVIPTRCDNILHSLSGHETKVSPTFLAIILGHYPTGASTYQFVHYGQLVESKRFCRYDFGTSRNFELYGQNNPPDYNLTNVVVPVVLFHGNRDWLSAPADVNILMRHLPNVYDETNLSDFTHIDYVYAEEAKEVVYDKIIEHIEISESIHYLDVKSRGMKTKESNDSSIKPLD